MKSILTHKKDNYIVIKPGDKGSASALWHRNNYVWIWRTTFRWDHLATYNNKSILERNKKIKILLKNISEKKPDRQEDL